MDCSISTFAVRDRPSFTQSTSTVADLSTAGSLVTSEAENSSDGDNPNPKSTSTVNANVQSQTDDVHCSCCRCIDAVNKQYTSTSVQCNDYELPVQLETSVSPAKTSTFGTQTTQATTVDSQLTDTLFEPTNGMSDESDCTELSDEDSIDNVVAFDKYLVFDSELVKLFKLCPDCKSEVIEIKKQTIGTMLTITSTCCNDHIVVWQSQPCIRRMPVGNLLLAAATVLSGCTYSQIKKLFNLLNTPPVSKSTFFRVQNTYINPAVNSSWLMHQTAIMSVLSEQELHLCGDARSDSPGFSAKYSSYSLMDMSSLLIVDQQLVALSEPIIQNSVSMEKEALDRSLQFLISSGLKIHTLATDRHTGVQSLLKENYPDIKHQFDVWHVAKNVTKKLHKKSLKKEANELMPWIRHIGNHLYWSAQSCNGDGELLKAKWMSCIYHITDVHSWNGELMVHCEHADIDDHDDVCWLEIESPAHKAMKAVVLDKKLLTDIVKLSDYCHTGALEVYHSMLLKYAPKRLHFNYAGMQTRLQLAAMDHNYNVDRKLAKDKEGNPLVRQAYTKAKKQWILRNVYEGKEYSYLSDIMRHIVQRREDASVKMDDISCQISLPTLKSNIAVTEKPSMDEAKTKKYSRMNK